MARTGSVGEILLRMTFATLQSAQVSFGYILSFILSIHIVLQPSMPDGKNGANGLNAQLLAGRVPKSGPERAANLPSEATSSVLGIQQRPGIAAQPNAEVNLKLK